MNNYIIFVFFLVVLGWIIYDDFRKINHHQSITGKNIDEYQLQNLYKSTRYTLSITNSLILIGVMLTIIYQPDNRFTFLILMGILMISRFIYVILLGCHHAYYGKNETHRIWGNIFMCLVYAWLAFNQLYYQKEYFHVIYFLLFLLLPLSEIIVYVLQKYHFFHRNDE